MSKFKQGGKPSRPVVVTSRKKAKLQRRLANEYGVQRAAHIKDLQEKAAEAIASSDNLHAQGQALREAVFAAGNKARPVPVQDPVPPNFARVSKPEPTYSEWMAEDDGWMTPESGWKNAIYRLKDGQKDIPLNCPHKHKTPDASRACALKAVKARNSSNRPMTDGWSATEAYPWSDEAVRALVTEIKAEGVAP